MSFWLIFCLPEVMESNASNLRVEYLVLREVHYGGTWEGDGQFACGHVKTQTCSS